MAVKQFEPDDPMLISATAVPNAGDDVLREIAVCIAEEYLRMGWPHDAVMALFSSPQYRVPHQAYQRLGPLGVLQAVSSAAARRPPRRVS